MAQDLAIQVDHVSKDFVLPHEKTGSVKSLFTGMFRRDKSYELQHALKDVSLEIKKGEFFGIVGRNGSGKSTLLKIIAEIYQPSHGHIKVHGKLVPFIELGVGFSPELTGRENVYLNGAMLGFTRSQVEANYQKIVEFSELEQFMDQKLKNYSSGMQVRLAFACATMAEADILLVDEVLAVGDSDFQRKCFNFFKQLKKDKKTVIFVSHDMSAVREYCDRAVLIEKNHIVHEGTADDVATEYVKLFNAPAGARSTHRDESERGRWGDGDVELTDVQIDVADEQLKITMEAVAHAEAEDPVFGYLVKDSAGNDLVGSNTKIKKHKVGRLRAGEKVTVHWDMPNVFNDGIFFITVAISHNDGVTQHDWWDNAASFRVFREDKTPFALNPHADIKIVKH
jgi:ABC-2 type transport system ATP-binding protein